MNLVPQNLVPRWPHATLDVAAAISEGFQPRPFREFVLKVHQRCNLACDYCYVYTMADQSWRDRPAVMTNEVWGATTRRIAEHAYAHSLGEVVVVLHGGEPLLVGVSRLAAMVGDLRSALPSGCRAKVVLQTNGVLLDEPTVRALCAAGIDVGVSLDGGPDENDRHRRRPDGRGSTEAVHRGLTVLTEARYRHAFAGLLCTIDLRSDPVETYESLLRYAPASIDFLLPHANWERPPLPHAGAGSAPYGHWLGTVFDRWYGVREQETRVRILEQIMSLVLGGSSRSEQVGLSPVNVVVIESDGAIEQVDSLKSTYQGACATGLNVFAHHFDEALHHPGIVARQLGAAALCDTCLGCPVHRVCGGGNYAHRYRASTGFRNPSVYCPDLLWLIGHIRRRLSVDLDARLANRS